MYTITYKWLSIGLTIEKIVNRQELKLIKECISNDRIKLISCKYNG